MKIIKCILCEGEMDIIAAFTNVVKICKCKNCGFSNEKKQQNIIVVQK